MPKRKTALTDDEIAEAFVDAFRSVVGNAIAEFDCQVLPNKQPKQVRVQITIFGHVEVPTRREFFQKVQKTEQIAIKCGKRRLAFQFEDSCDKNSNDYCLFYIAKL